ncbi:hypothetical protein PFISCL1PPCAC_7978, partial [Pristionchus fissidentatus]
RLFVDLLTFRQIDSVRVNRSPGVAEQRLGHLVALLVHIPQHENAASFGELDGHQSADAASGASDKTHITFDALSGQNSHGHAGFDHGDA